MRHVGFSTLFSVIIFFVYRIICFKINSDSSPSFDVMDYESEARNCFSPAHYKLKQELVPKVIKSEYDMPICILGIKYDYKAYENGKYVNKTAAGDLGGTVKLKRTFNPPRLEYLWAINRTYYTAVMIDMDSPSHKKRSDKFWLHWLVMNIPDDELNNGTTVVEYVGPWPKKGTGKHRYVVVIYEQDGAPFPMRLNNVPIKYIKKDDFISRRKFDLHKFVKDCNFLNPVSINWFTMKWEKLVDKHYGKYIKKQK